MAAQPPAAVPHRIQRSLSAPWRWYYSWVLKTVFSITILITVDRTDLAEKIGTLSRQRVRQILDGIQLLLEPRDIA